MGVARSAVGSSATATQLWECALGDKVYILLPTLCSKLLGKKQDSEAI